MAPNSNETNNGDDDPTITNVLKRSKDPLEGIIFSLRRPMSDLGPGLVLLVTSIPFFVGTYLGYKNSQNFDKVIGKSFSQLEWRIREDVPTNLRAVKRASMLIAMRQLNDARMRGYEEKGPFSTQATANGARRLQPVPMRVKVDWDRDETMAAYLKD